MGATRPEEYGYYFWWGDTVGYKRQGGSLTEENHWINYLGVTWVSSAGISMSKTPFASSACPTFGKDKTLLRSLGYIDSKNNLVAGHDAATQHLGVPWRMPTSAEISELVGMCDAEWIVSNGVHGCLVKGRGDFASKSIFLPAAGGATEGGLYCPGTYGKCWSSTLWRDSVDSACHLSFAADEFAFYNNPRDFGRSVRAVCGSSGDDEDGDDANAKLNQ